MSTHVKWLSMPASSRIALRLMRGEVTFADNEFQTGPIGAWKSRSKSEILPPPNSRERTQALQI
jgi:hypothetical protein